MTLARVPRWSALSVGLSAALTSSVSAQDQTWIQQFGTSTLDFAQSAVPDDTGGVFVCGATHGNLGGPNAKYGARHVLPKQGDGGRTCLAPYLC